MTYARLRDILNMLDKGQLDQEAYFLANGVLNRIDYVDSFNNNEELAIKFGSTPHQVFITNTKEL